MRGKSLTCRKSPIIDLAVYDRGSETPPKKKGSVTASHRLAAHRRGEAINQARFSDAGCSIAGGGSRSLLYPHSSSAQRRVVPFLVVFSSRKGLPHCGHFSGTGLSQKTVSHFG